MRVLQTATYISIGGQQIPVVSWDVTLSSNGQLATCNAITSLALCNVFGIDITSFQDANGSDFDVFVGYNGNLKHIFGGVLDQVRWEFGDDKIDIKALDYACVLRDTNVTLASLNVKNQTVGQIIQQIADKMGFTANITDPGVTAGSLINGDSSLMPTPQPYWTIIGNLAEQTSSEYYVTPDKVLYFGPTQGASTQGTINTIWGAAVTDNPSYFLKSVSALWQPRDNSNFTVKVISHNAKSGKILSHTKAITGHQLKKRKTKKIKQLELVGTSNGSKSTVGKSLGKPSTKPVFVYRVDGLTPEQCEARAASIAKDMAKRLVILEGELVGTTDALIHTELNVDEGSLDLSGFDSLVYDMTEVRHTYLMPQSFGGGGGWLTHFKALAQLDN